MRHSYSRLGGGKWVAQIGGGLPMISSRSSVNRGPLIGNYRAIGCPGDMFNFLTRLRRRGKSPLSGSCVKKRTLVLRTQKRTDAREIVFPGKCFNFSTRLRQKKIPFSESRVKTDPRFTDSKENGCPGDRFPRKMFLNFPDATHGTPICLSVV